MIVEMTAEQTVAKIMEIMAEVEEGDDAPTFEDIIADANLSIADAEEEFCDTNDATITDICEGTADLAELLPDSP